MTRSRLDRSGYGRRRSGTGFTYLDRDGGRLTDPQEIGRIRALVVPPAWADVWISPDPRGHIQAVGRDEAGRKQYVYHPDWRQQRDRAKFDHALELAEHLPELRERLETDLAGRGLSRQRVLAAIVRLLDMGKFRVGSEQYANRDEDPSYGLSTLRPDHVRSKGGCTLLEFDGKSGVRHTSTVGDGEVCQVLKDLRRRRRGEDRLFAYWTGRAWHEVRADEINEYLREATGEEMTAKDFRTWHGTVTAATELAEAGPKDTRTARKKAVNGAVKKAAELLGNTPAVARSSYVDPRVIEAYERGETAEGEAEVIELLG